MGWAGMGPFYLHVANRGNFHFPGPAANSLPRLILPASSHPLCLMEMFVLDVLAMGERKEEGLLSWDCVVDLCQGFFESGAKFCYLFTLCTSSFSEN